MYLVYNIVKYKTICVIYRLVCGGMVMNMIEILKAINSIARSYAKPISGKQANGSLEEQIESLRRKVKQICGDKGLDPLNEILNNIASQANLQETSSSSSYAASSSDYVTNTKKYSEAHLYQQILPLCQLACLVEQNGYPEDYASKLSRLFNSEQDVYKYLDRYISGKGNVLTPLFYNACKFELPRDGSCNFPLWKKIAIKYMHFPRFRALLPHAGEIEKINDNSAKKVERKHDEAVGKVTELQKVQREFRRIKAKEMITPTQEEKRHRLQILAELSQRISYLNSELVQLAIGTPLNQAPLAFLDAFYEHYKAERRKIAGEIMTRNGISRPNQDILFSLQRNNDDKAVPAITVKGSEIGYPGFYLTKLDTQTDEGAALAACLGMLTKCCQYLGGAGGMFVNWGIELSNAGFYVLFKGNENEPDITIDQVIAQAFVWRCQNESLCLDSVEESVPLDTASLPTLCLIGDMYRYLSMLLCEQKGIKRVTVGEDWTGDSGSFAQLNNYVIPPLKGIEACYKSDEMDQFLVADKKMPYLFYQYAHESPEFRVNRSELLRNMIDKRTESFIEDIFSVPESLRNNDELKSMIHFLIDISMNKTRPSSSFLKTLKEDSLFNLMTSVAEKHYKLDELCQLVVNQIYVSFLNQSARIHARTSEGQKLLRAMLADSRTFEEILKIIPESGWLDALMIADADGHNPLHFLIKYPESLVAIFTLMPDEQKIRAISEKNTRGESLLDLLEKDPQLKSAMMSLVVSDESQLREENITCSSESLGHCGFFSGENSARSTGTVSPDGPEDQASGVGMKGD